jgi:hypothetical protein
MTEISTLMGKAGTVAPYMPVGIDGGNGAQKIVTPTIEKRGTSIFAIITDEIFDVPESTDGAYVEYLDGIRKDLVGKRWITGSAAYTRFPDTHLEIRDDRRGKILWGLLMLLGIVGTFPHENTLRLSLTVSCQDEKAYGEELKKTLSGVHVVEFNKKKESSIEIHVNKVVDEGVGAIVEATVQGIVDPRKGNVIIFDLGFGTIITSPFAPGGKLIERNIHPAGVDSLYSAISQDVETRRELGKEANIQLIQRGVENRSFEYGSRGWNFAHIYKNALRSWAEKNLIQALKSVDQWRDDAAGGVLAIGGGSELPGISDFLESKGIATMPDASWANARGLFRIAQMQCAKGA